MAETENINYLLTEKQVVLASQKVASRLQEEIDRGHQFGAFTILISIALIKDFWGVIGNITLIKPLLDLAGIGILIDWFISGILWFFMRQQGWWLQRKISDRVNKYQLKLAFWLMSFFDSVPIISTLPLQTFSVLKVWKKVRQQAGASEQELETLNYTTREELERIYSENEIEEEAEEDTDSEEDEISPGTTTDTRKQESAIIKAGVDTTEEIEKGQETFSSSETTEEIFIPQEVRDPMGKLKREYFETPPDEIKK